MAVNVCVPCNFDVENLYDQFYGNVDIVFSDESKMKANSLILSWNSATFSKFFNELKLSRIEIKDFTKEAVIMFLECLYSGDVKLEKRTFREIYKLSVVFKTSWLQERCTEFFSNFCENILNEFEDICFAFDEAFYCKKAMKSDDLFEIVDKTFIKIPNIEIIFVEHYLNTNYAAITSETLDHLMLLSQENFSPVVTCLKQRLVDGEIDATTRSLLSNSKIVEWFADNVECYEDVYELLTLKTESMTVEDFKMLTYLNLSVIKVTRSLRQTDSKQVVLVQDIPNLFHDWKLFYGLSDEEFSERLSSMPDISVFLVVELCGWFDSLRRRGGVNAEQYITQVCANKSMCRVPRSFVQNFISPGIPVSIPRTLVSEEDTALIVGTETTLSELVSSAELYKFHFRHPAARQCEKHTECGFMLKVTPCSKEETGKFNIKLVTEESEYPAGIHCHSEVISAAHMHLVMEVYYRGRWYNRCISWAGKPEYSEKRGCALHNLSPHCTVWGGRSCNDTRVTLAVYYDIRDKM